MWVKQTRWTPAGGWHGAQACDASLVLVFGARALLEDGGLMQDIRTRAGGAVVVGCSTAGEIVGETVIDDSVTATAVKFDRTGVRACEARLRSPGASAETGRELARALAGDGLRHVLVVSEGLNVNGSELVHGLASELPPAVTITGGLAADGADFKRTVVVSPSGVREGSVAAVGLYGDKLQVGCASLGGWDAFGPERRVTRAEGNVLYELDGRSALELYKTYLGDYASGLPSSGLLFPLSIRTSERTAVVRSLLSIDEAEQSVTFAGTIPEGSFARLMKANFDRLIDGAYQAASLARPASGRQAELALLISCVGRRLVLRGRVDEEIEAAREVLGPQPVLTGFYSYGEISPFTPEARCELHNQTMTITTFGED